MTRKLHYSWIVIIFSCTAALAQEQKQTLEQADEYYSRYEYTLAARLYEKLAAKKKIKPGVLEKLASCYRKTNQYAYAAKWYGRIAQDSSAATDNLFYYADMLKCQGSYADAKKAFEAYRQKGGSLPGLAERIAGCDSALNWIQHPAAYRIDNLRVLNTTASDWGATWYGKDSIVFTSDYIHPYSLDEKTRVNNRDFGWTDKPYQKTYLVDSTPARGFGIIGDLSSVINQYLFHIGPVAFSSQGDTAYITVTNPVRLPYKREKPLEVYGTRRLALYIAVKKNNRWQKPYPFTYSKPEAYSLGHAALSKNGNILYFTSDMPGSLGKTDIWYCEKTSDSSWTAPRNCGPQINTPDEEAFPTIVAEGTELYFSSKGHTGMGGFDLFRSTGEKDQWQQAQNLQYPLNSPGDDFYYTTRDQVSGFIASNRPGGIGADDIYRFILNRPPVTVTTAPPPAVLMLETTVLDKKTNAPLPAAYVELHNRSNDRSWLQSTPSSGKVYNVLEPQTQYTINARKNGYDTAQYTQSSGAARTDTLRVTLLLDAEKLLRPGQVFVLQNLYYDLDQWNIRPDAAKVLDSLALVLQQHPTLKIALSSHTDSRATAAYNMQLSEKRARAAVAYLVQKGIAATRLVPRWYGESHPVNKCVDGIKCSEAEYQANRRTEVEILGR